MEADSFSLKLTLSVLTKEDKASWLCSTYFEYSTYGVNGSEPLTTFVNPVHDIMLFAYQLQICPSSQPLVNPCQLRSRYDKIKAPQILHGRNTLQKYVENRELPKSTHKVLKIKEY